MTYRIPKYYCNRDKKKLPWAKVRKVCLMKGCHNLQRILKGIRVKVN
jgi:hypothetical protein